MIWLWLAALIGGTGYGLMQYVESWYLLNTETEQAIEGFALLLYAWPVSLLTFLVSLCFLPWAFGAHKRLAENMDQRTIKQLKGDLAYALNQEKSADDRAKRDAELTVSEALHTLKLQKRDLASRETALTDKEAVATARIEQARLDTLNAEQSLAEALVKKQQAQGAAARWMKKRHKYPS